jgi:acyl-CoA reductase-like NAD-dependent aldehyde dehydrogenase
MKAMLEVSMQHVQLLIDGRDVDASNGATFTRLNPISGEVASIAAAASVADAVAAADAAARAFPAWSASGPGERRAKLQRAADLLEAQAERFTAIAMAETGSTTGWAQFNVHKAASMLREAAAMTTQICGEVIPSDVPGSLAMAIRQPVGVVLGLAPWNAPIILGVRAIAMPLACGNTVILKASEICPATHRLIGDVLQEAGLGDGVINVITHDAKDAPAVAEAMIAHPAVRRINFTGSTRTGKALALVAAKYLKPILLELGGKAPLVVLADADIDAAVAATVFGAFANQGQICMSTERVIIDETIADEFAGKLARRVAALPSGDPHQGEVVLGAVVNTATVERVRNLVTQAVAQGAKLLAGGTAQGTVMQGVVVDHVTADMALFREETFGPQVSITRVKSVDEAVRLANDTEYGLSAAVFSRDVGGALAVAKRIDTGICHINGPTVHDEAQMPFGGVKASGYGRFGGKAGLEQFTELRWITIQTAPRHYPF